jgi:hypothetical protein
LKAAAPASSKTAAAECSALCPASADLKKNLPAVRMPGKSVRLPASPRRIAHNVSSARDYIALASRRLSIPLDLYQQTGRSRYEERLSRLTPQPGLCLTRKRRARNKTVVAAAGLK